MSQPPRDQSDLAMTKQAIREQMWRLLAENGVMQTRRLRGHIPDFHGSRQAALNLSELAVWRSAQVVKTNPDRAQLPVRVQALYEGKLVYMPVPNLAREQPFYRLNPEQLVLRLVPFEELATSGNVSRYAPSVGLDYMRQIDLVVSGAIAVNATGARVGNGIGYSDIEIGLLAEVGLLGDWTTFVATVHDAQVVDHALPEVAHDFSIDIIVTPTRVIPCQPQRRPMKLDRRLLTPEQISAMPVLQRLI